MSFEEKYRELASEQLVEIATSPADFTDEAVAAARAELDRRGVPIEPPLQRDESPAGIRPWKSFLGLAVLAAAVGFLLLARRTGEEHVTPPAGFVEPVCGTIDFAGCQRACAGGKAQGCINLGTMQLEGIQTRKDLEKAAATFRRACDLGDPRGCLFAGDALGAAHGEKPPLDPASAVSLLEKACGQEVWAACTQLGVHLELGAGVAKDVVRARALYERACHRKDGHGCTRLGYLYESGTADAKDETAAVRLYRKACDLSDRYGCFALAVMVDEGRGTQQDKGRAGEIFAELCHAHGDARACKRANLDDPFARRHAEMRAGVEEKEQLCRSGDLSSCSALGVAYDAGLGVNKDFDYALKLQTRACEGDVARACYLLGHMYEEGTGYGLDPEAARPFFEKACRLGEELACRWLQSPW